MSPYQSNNHKTAICSIRGNISPFIFIVGSVLVYAVWGFYFQSWDVRQDQPMSVDTTRANFSVDAELHRAFEGMEEVFEEF